MYDEEVNKELLSEAFQATCKKRETVFTKTEVADTLALIEKDEGVAQMWEQFRKKNYFVGELEWEIVLQDVLRVIEPAVKGYKA